MKLPVMQLLERAMRQEPRKLLWKSAMTWLLQLVEMERYTKK